MTQEEYEKAKTACWDEFWDEISGAIAFTSGAPERMKEHIYDTFDRAYALGKQEKDADASLWGRLTDDEKREMRCRYHTNECVLTDHRKRTGDKAQSKATARMKLLENLFGKENLKERSNE